MVDEVRDEAAVEDKLSRKIAEEIVGIARDATAGLPFGTDPTAFTAALESLAGGPPEASP